MKRLTVAALCMLMMVFAVSAVWAYTPPPGVLGPDDVDFGGRTVSWIGWYYPWGGFEEGAAYAGRLEEAEELFNVRFNYIDQPWGEALTETMMARLLSGDSTHDFWLLPEKHAYRIAPSGAFFPAGEVLPASYFAALTEEHRNTVEALTFRGQKLTWGHGGYAGIIRYVFWNKTLFEREGLPNLYDLWYDGNWTWDVMTDIARQATRDTTGDGEIDQWGLGALAPPNWILVNDGRMVKADEDGRYVFAMDEESSVTALNQIYLWQQVEQVTGGDWAGEAFIDGRVAMDPLELWRIGGIFENMEDEWGIVSKPRGPHAADYRYPAQMIDALYLPANVEDPEAMIALHRFLFRVEEQEGDYEDWMMSVVPSQESWDVVIAGRDNFSGEVNMYEYVLDIGIIWEVTSGERSAAGAMAEVKPRNQAILDDLFGQ